MNPRNGFRAIFATAMALALWSAGPAAAQQTGTIQGTVVEAATQRPLPGAQVSITGTQIGTITNQQGRFQLVNVPAGTHEVRVTLIGYARGSETANVSAGESVTLNLTVRETAVELEGIVVNPITGREERRRELGTNTASIQSADINPAAVTTFSDVLQGRAPGVNLQLGSGTVGTGERIRIRGANSLSLSNEPLLYIDGVRASRSQGGFGVGGQNPSRLNDINPADIENVEILKGPAATALYGTAGAAGVILITTKRGVSGAPRWNAFVERAQLADVTQYPANFVAVQRNVAGAPAFTPDGFLNTDEGAVRNCLNVAAAAGFCTQDEVLSFNTLLDPRTRPFTTGHRQRQGVNVSGGAQGVNYFISGELENTQGVIDFNTNDKGTFRANLRAGLTENFTVNVTTGYTRNHLALNNNDNSVFSPLINGLLGRPTFVQYDSLPGPTDNRNYGWGYTVDHLRAFPTRQEVDRITLGLNAEYRPLNWLAGNINVGLDLVDRHDNNDVAQGDLPIGGTFSLGFRQSSRSNTHLWSGAASGTALFDLTGNIRSTTTLGSSFERSSFQSTYCFGADLIPGTRSCGAANQQFSVNENFNEVVTVGAYVQQGFAFDDRVFLNLSLRGDDDSAFGEDFGLAYFPGASLSWVASEEGWFPQTGALSEVRLRAAAGTSGTRPGFRQAVTLFGPVAVSVGGQPQAGVILNTAGNPTLRPERTTEFEGGFDVGLFQDRLGLEFTYFNKTSRDAIIARRLPPSLGLTATVLENLGSVQNVGTELALSLRAFETPTMRGNLRVSHSTLRNEIRELGEGVEPIIFNRGAQRHDEGFPAGAFFQRRYEFDRPEQGNVLRIADVRLARDADGALLDAEYIGPSLPTWTTSFGGDLSFLNNLVTVSTLFEGRGGNYQINYTEFFRCNIGAGRGDSGCRAAWDPTASQEEQARFIAARFLAPTTTHGYIERADFVKWRELAVSLGVPPMLRERAPLLNGVTLTLAGRNLATWTGYSGLDPEVQETGGTAGFTQGEFNTQPPLRHFTARFNVAF